MDYATLDRISKLEALARATTYPAERAEAERQIAALKAKAGVKAGVKDTGPVAGAGSDEKRRRPDPEKRSAWADHGWREDFTTDWRPKPGYSPFDFGSNFYGAPRTSYTSPPPVRPTRQEMKNLAVRIATFVSLADSVEWDAERKRFVFWSNGRTCRESMGSCTDEEASLVQEFYNSVGIHFDIPERRHTY